jgi:16S rRNA A1518/A1519 N6-dimethyltransferase RsmA/KsgA/DIM1 with predicted DNA glycosylase/AP lyase activity
LYKVVDWSFISRRKNIRNNLKKRDVNWDLLDIDNNLRPEEVCLEDYMKLAEALKE